MDSTEGPLVSFCVKCYNQERYIGEALEGAFAQTYRPLEIVISDDASTDRSWEIITEAVAKYRHRPDATRTIISLSVYPPIRERLNGIIARCRSEGVPLVEKDSGVFMTRYVPEGNIDMRKAFRHCRGNSFFCPILREGRIYNCAMGCYAHYWNRSAPTPFPVEKGLPLAESTGVEILLYLMSPMPTCAHCATTKRDYPWHNGAPKLEDWIR